MMVILLISGCSVSDHSFSFRKGAAFHVAPDNGDTVLVQHILLVCRPLSIFFSFWVVLTYTVSAPRSPVKAHAEAHVTVQ